jgi:putative ABC transport system permease protein
MNPLRKDLFREIKNTRGRFLSILFIVLIGVAFFAGIWASPKDMLYSADSYYDEYNLMDIKVLSNYGITEDDVNEISKIENVGEVYASYTYDFMSNSQEIMRVASFNLDDLINEDYINKYKLVKGELPKNRFECVIEYNQLIQGDYIIGNYISLIDPENKLISHSYKIVGLINTPFYLNYEKGSSDLGRGTVDRYMYIEESNFNMEVYTEVYLTINDIKKYNSYDEIYFENVKPVKNELLALGNIQSEIRYDDIMDEALSELNKYKKEYEDGLDEYNTKIKDAETLIKDGEDEILLGKANISTGRIVLDANITSSREQIKLIEEQLNSLELQADVAKEQYSTQETAANLQKESLVIANQTLEEELAVLEPGFVVIENRISELNSTNAELSIELAQMQLELAELDTTSPEYLILQTEITAKTAEITANSTELLSLQLDNEYLVYQSKKQQYDLNNQQIILIENGLTQASQSFELIDSQVNEANKLLDEQNRQLDEMKITQTKIIDQKERELLDGEKELAKSKVTLEDEKVSGLIKLEDGAEEIKKAEKDISLIENSKWYVLDRNSHYSYVDYRMTAEKMEAIAMVFPVFFLLVAALVTLTTMSRLVDEKRTEIGTFKALGYKEGTIMSKYLLYGLLATIIGSIFGLLVGMTVFPKVIYDSWNLMYILPPIKYVLQVPLMIITVVITIFVTGSTTIFACYQQMKEVPSMLLRPKPPKSGKTILLERSSFIWNRLSFTSKVTARNIFRYKKKMSMTIIGITGCTALLVAGFGISDSITDLVSIQFESIYKYNGIASVDSNLSSLEKRDLKDSLNDGENISDTILVDIQNAKIVIKGSEESVKLVVPENDNHISEFINLRDRKTQELYDLDIEGVMITEKFARDNNIKKDDLITIVNEDDYSEEFLVSNIVENYIGNNIYMSNNLYESKYDIKPVYNNIYLNTEVDDAKVAEIINENESVESVVFYTSIINSFKDTVESLNIVVLVLVVSAACLAFVVLYNLTNVNISERMREIATLKVLGFRNKEVNSYVYRENMLLTVMGTIVGLIAGSFLHQLIMYVVETNDIMYGRTINLFSFVIAFILTISFSIIVNIIMSFKLKNIKMVESLKSVE